MKATAEPPSPKVLGFIGKEHFRTKFDEWYGIKAGRFYYKRSECVVDGIPYIIEAASAEVDSDRGEMFLSIEFQSDVYRSDAPQFDVGYVTNNRQSLSIWIPELHGRLLCKPERERMGTSETAKRGCCAAHREPRVLVPRPWQDPSKPAKRSRV
jgi:hypothetical protein